MRVCIFGRDGLHYSVKVNIHERPAVFVRFMLGALSLEADAVGFDPTIYYQEGQRHVRTRDSDGNEVRHTMVHERPVFYRRTIRGRGTTCWMVKNDEDDIFIVKDGWKALDRVPESSLLEKTTDLPGVGKMRGSEPSMVKLSTLRLIDVGSMSPEMAPFFQDRELHRVVLHCYGPSLEGFKSKLELLYAYHDALLGMSSAIVSLVDVMSLISFTFQDTRRFIKGASFTAISASTIFSSESRALPCPIAELSSISTWLSNWTARATYVTLIPRL